MVKKSPISVRNDGFTLEAQSAITYLKNHQGSYVVKPKYF